MSPHTISNYRRDLEKLLAVASGTPLAGLQVHHIRRFVAQMHGQGLSGRSLARLLSAWRGFFLWLDVSHLAREGRTGGEAAALRLWREQGLRTVPGGYLARRDITGANPAEGWLRVALVHDIPTSEEVLKRLVAGLAPALD